MVLGFSLAKEGVEDYRRHKQDTQNNLSTVNRVVTIASPDNNAAGPFSIWRPWRFRLWRAHTRTSTVTPIDYTAGEEAVYWQDIRVRLSLHSLTLAAHTIHTYERTRLLYAV